MREKEIQGTILARLPQVFGWEFLFDFSRVVCWEKRRIFQSSLKWIVYRKLLPPPPPHPESDARSC